MIGTALPHPILRKAERLRLFGKSPFWIFLRLNRQAWQRLPCRVRNFYPLRLYGAWLHSLVCLHAASSPAFQAGLRPGDRLDLAQMRCIPISTCFLRNRPMLELMRRLADQKANGSTLRIVVLACSIGAEVYSILWTIRSARPDLKVLLSAVDISPEVLNVGEKAIYGPNVSELVSMSIFERLTVDEMGEMFDWNGNQARVKPWLREAITWRLGDASDPELIRVLGPQDMVVANNFLCHMEPQAAENCLRNITGLVDRGGYLFVSGVDLEVRAKVAAELGWRPMLELLEQIHDGDASVRGGWPFEWWGLEPLDHRRRDWPARYAVAFQLYGV
jgi:CheR methyltransferase, SAM binding domain